MKRTTLILITGFVLLWNSGFIGAVYGLPYTGPFTLVFWRYLALTLVIVLYLLLRQRFRWVSWNLAAPHMLIGILAHGLWLTCVLLALDYQVPAGIVALIVALQPLATGALSGVVVGGEQANWYQWLGLVLGFLGVVITVAFRIDFGSYSSIFGYLIPLGSVIGMTGASLIQRRMEVEKRSKKLPVDLALFYQSLATTLALVLPAIFIEKLATQWEAEFIYAMIWLTLAVSLGAYVLLWLLIERIEATRVASLFYLGPPVTMFMAWLAFGDKIQPMDMVGLAVVFMGVYLSQLKAKNP
ncbi:DMT family transporter [Cyclobacterium roseum]|uniref:DMT family transporter n=1 Tax=Cyclobacterium roseum TaxID=2666137 RepID=UPI001391127C|nr:DMT family transporter [Cyclobacterium roseum]